MKSYIAFNTINNKYLGKTGLHKDSTTSWTEYPRFYPTIKGLKSGINSCIGGWQNSYTMVDIEIIELDDPFTIVARYGADTV